MSPILGVVGTDTGVGKTVVCQGLLQALRQAGLRAAGFKVVETGIPEEPSPKNREARADWQRLEEASGQETGTALGDSFPLPAAPLVAARAAGRRIHLEEIRDRLLALSHAHDWVICEGAGGFLVPMAEGLLWGDLIGRWTQGCLLVGRLGLGTINHTLLTLEAMRARGLEPLGVILSATSIPTDEAIYTVDMIREFVDTPVLDPLPFGVCDPSAVALHLRRSGLLELLGSRVPDSP